MFFTSHVPSEANRVDLPAFCLVAFSRTKVSAQYLSTAAVLFNFQEWCQQICADQILNWYLCSPEGLVGPLWLTHPLLEEVQDLWSTFQCHHQAPSLLLLVGIKNCAHKCTEKNYLSMVSPKQIPLEKYKNWKPHGDSSLSTCSAFDDLQSRDFVSQRFCPGRGQRQGHGCWVQVGGLNASA